MASSLPIAQPGDAMNYSSMPSFFHDTFSSHEFWSSSNDYSYGSFNLPQVDDYPCSSEIVRTTTIEISSEMEDKVLNAQPMCLEILSKSTCEGAESSGPLRKRKSKEETK